MKKMKSSSEKSSGNKKVKNKKKRPSSYTIEQSIGARESGIYKFPGQFLLFGVLLIFLWAISAHPLRVTLLILGVFSIGLEAIFLSRRFGA